MTGPGQPQWFHFGPWVFSIDAAEALIATTPRDTRPLDVAAWATAYGLTRLDDPHRVNLIGPTRTGLNRAYAMTTDLTKPVIVAQLDVTGQPPSPLLIDGIHRLYRARREHVPRLPAYLLTAEETRQIQDNVLLGPGGTTPPPPSSRPDTHPPRTPRTLPNAGGDRGVRVSKPPEDTSWPTRHRG